MIKTGISLKVKIGPETQLGPGKAALLEAIRDTGSISAAGRALGMSYKTAWLLLETLNVQFVEPMVTTSKGGSAKGGAELTKTGHAVLDSYRRMEAAAKAAVGSEMRKLSRLMKPIDAVSVAG